MIDHLRKMIDKSDPALATAADCCAMLDFVERSMAIRSDPIRSDPIRSDPIRSDYIQNLRPNLRRHAEVGPATRERDGVPHRRFRLLNTH